MRLFSFDFVLASEWMFLLMNEMRSMIKDLELKWHFFMFYTNPILLRKSGMIVFPDFSNKFQHLFNIERQKVWVKDGKLPSDLIGVNPIQMIFRAFNSGRARTRVTCPFQKRTFIKSFWEFKTWITTNTKTGNPCSRKFHNLDTCLAFITCKQRGRNKEKAVCFISI